MAVFMAEFCLKSGCNIMGTGRKGGVAVSMLKSFFLVAWSDEMFVVHDVHFLTRGDVAVMPRACSWITVDSDRSTTSRCVCGTEM